MTPLLALATLGDPTQIGMILFVLHCLRWLIYIGQDYRVAKSQMFLQKNFTNVNDAFSFLLKYFW
jgi:hypothetical protein